MSEENETARAWLACGLDLVRVGEPALSGLAEHGDWIGELLGERGWLPPVGVVIDLGRLVTGGRVTGEVLPAISPELRSAIRSYQDQLLGRIEMNPLFDQLVDGLMPLEGTLKTRAVAVLTSRLLGRVGCESASGVAIRPALVRSLARAPIDEISSYLEARSDFDGELTVSYEALAAGARRSSRLLDQTDLFLVEHIAALGDLSQRLAVEQMVTVATELRTELPRRLKPRARERYRVPTRMTEEDLYPVGGFASIATSGTIENLVISELVYMDDDEDLDLFDLRYAERELLYYTRDDSLFRRGHRAIRLALLPDLVRARVKDEESRWQRLVALCGMITAIIDRLVTWLESEALDVRVVFVAAADGSSLAEQSLVEILLSEWIERGVVRLEVVGSLGELATAAAEAAEIGESNLVLVTTDPRIRAPVVPRVETALLNLTRARPHLSWRHRPAEPPGEEVAVWSAWRSAAVGLLQELI